MYNTVYNAVYNVMNGVNLHWQVQCVEIGLICDFDIDIHMNKILC